MGVFSHNSKLPCAFVCYLVYIVLTNTLYTMSTITISFAVRESKARTSGEVPIQVLLPYLTKTIPSMARKFGAYTIDGIFFCSGD